MAAELKHDVFRFVALRPPVLPDATDPVAYVIRDGRLPGDTAVGQVVEEMTGGGGGEGQARVALGGPSHGEFAQRLQEYVQARGLEPELPAGEVADQLRSVGRALQDAIDAREPGQVEARVREVLGRDPGEFLADEQVIRVRDEVWDRLQSFYLLGRQDPRSVDELVDALRALRLVELIVAEVAVGELTTLRRVAETTLVLPGLGVEAEPQPVVPTPRSEAQQAADAAKAERYTAQWTEFLELSAAAKTLRETRFDVAVQQGRHQNAFGGTLPPPLGGSGSRETETVRRTLPTETVANLPEAAKRVVASLPLGQSLSDKPLVIEALQNRLGAVTDRIVSSNDPMLFETMPPAAAALPGMQSLGLKYQPEASPEVEYEPPTLPFPWVVRPVIRPLGIGDLKVVKQKLLRYVAGEVAHIENVLDGEKKERTHRRLDRTEQTFTVETETVEETERDNQTTDRFELKKESEKTIKEDMSVDAGITVSASYGPVELGAYGNFAYSQSTTETIKNSLNFARDVVDRSLTKIQKRAREERVTKTLKEIEESNIHGIDNSPAGGGHVTGIYRWVDKHYEAQVYNYGRRMMFEFVVPEPAAYYYFSQENDPANKLDIRKPEDLGLLSHSDVQYWNFGNYVRAYNVQGITPPPPHWKVMTAAFEQSGMQDNQTSSKASKDLIVPDGYVARSWGYNYSGWVGSNKLFTIHVGLEENDPNGTYDLNGEDSVVPISIVTHDVRAYAVNVEVFCERTDRAYKIWQIQTFEKIVAAYEAARAAYEDKVKAAEVARGIVIEGRNPGINLQIIRNELKKQSITLFTGEDYSSFDSVSGTPPTVDLNEAADEARFIQFFEQAFEWEQMTYLFYPYFWSRPSTWNKRLAFNDQDPHFNQFLQAGAARVVVPVRNAYNDALLHYVETGALWNGGTPPHLDDPMFVSIVEELKARTDDLEGATPEGDPWKVVVPTTLVYLQADAALPDYTAP
ncbi:hypothetical protein ACWHLZ_06420 [Streptomyces chartreusis]